MYLNNSLIRTLFVLSFLVILVLANQDLYKVLGVSKKATDKDLKKAYKKLSKRYHPDKNPEDKTAHDKFVEISEAYEILSDKEKRRIYDQQGLEGLKRFQKGHQDPFDLFQNFFGRNMKFSNGNQAQRGPDMQTTLDISLDMFYLGGELSISIEKQLLCDDCDGNGWDTQKYTQEQAVETCTHCDGHGIIVKRHQIHPGFVQSVQMVCNHCNGKGSTIKKLCPTCQGKKVRRRVEDHDIQIPAGAPVGEQIILDGEADQSPDWEPGNLILNLQLDRSKSKGWIRRANDLIRDEILTVQEALLGGWEKKIPFFDGEELTVSRPVGQTVQPNEIETISNHGLPSWNFEDHLTDYEKRGSVYIRWHIVLPKDTKSKKFQDSLKKIFNYHAHDEL